MHTADMTRQEAADWVAYLDDKPKVTGKPLSEQERFDLQDCRDRIAELDVQQGLAMEAADNVSYFKAFTKRGQPR